MQSEDEIKFLREQLASRDNEIAELQKQLSRLTPNKTNDASDPVLENLVSHQPDVDVLDNKSIARYSRQLILPQLGPGGQLKLRGEADHANLFSIKELDF